MCEKFLTVLGLLILLIQTAHSYGSNDDVMESLKGLSDAVQDGAHSYNREVFYEEHQVALGVGAILGIAIGSIVFFILCCVCILRCCCGCCRRDTTYVQTTVISPVPTPANHTFINMGQPAYPTAPAPHQQPYPQIPVPFQQQPRYEPLANEAPPQYFPKQ